MADTRVVLPEDLLPSDLPSTGIPLYGIRRDAESLVQVLALEPRKGLDHLGEARAFFTDRPGLTVTTSECRLDGRRAQLEFVQALDRATVRNGDRTLASAHVVCVGAGSVGGALALLLAQAGCGRLTVIDPDAVDTPNLARTPYRMEDLGRRKVDALAERLTGANPAIEIDPVGARFSGELPAADLLLASTDDAAVQLQANRAALENGIRALFVGCHARAASGEVLWVIPGATACYACTFARIRARAPRRRTPPYRVDRHTQGVVGLGADVAHTVSIAAAHTLALLGEPRRAGLLADADRNLVLIQSGQEPNRRSRMMALETPFALNRPSNPPDRRCPHCSPDDGVRFLAGQADLVAEITDRGGSR